MCQYKRHPKLLAWMTSVLLLWLPSSVSALRSLSEITSALHYQHHSTHCSSPTANNRSTDDAPCTLLFPILTRGTHVRMLFVDYSSAFNTIVPSKLVVKLRALGLKNSLCSWILDFLTGRWLVVRVGSNISSPLTLNTGSVFSAFSCTPCTRKTVQPCTAPTSSSNLRMTQWW